MKKEARSQTPHYPTYENVRYFLKLIDGVDKSKFFHMRSEIDNHKGDPQHQVNWTNPDEWIYERLSGDNQMLAIKIWEGSEKELNPRHLRGEWYLSQRHDLLIEDGLGMLHITSRGESFINDPRGQVVAKVDQHEGVFIILQLIAELGPGKRSTFLPKYTEYSHNFTHDKSENVIKSRMYARLNNLRARGFVEMNVHTYEITESGLGYLEYYSELIKQEGLKTQTLDIERLAKQHREIAKKELSDYLLEMDPFKFEDLVKFLLEEMGYIDVKVTSPVNDKGWGGAEKVDTS